MGKYMNVPKKKAKMLIIFQSLFKILLSFTRLEYASIYKLTDHISLKHILWKSGKFVFFQKFVWKFFGFRIFYRRLILHL